MPTILVVDDQPTNRKLIKTVLGYESYRFLEGEARQLAKACGVSHLILKPAEPQEILSAVHAVLHLKEPAPSYNLSAAFDREHLRLMTNKLSDKVDELEEINLRLTQEVGQRKRAELALQESQGRLERLSSIREVSSDINSAIVRIRNRHELLQEAARVAVKHGQFSMVAISVVDSASAQLVPAACAEVEALYARTPNTSSPTHGEA